MFKPSKFLERMTIEQKNCPRCGSGSVRLKGYVSSSMGYVRQLQCKSCGYRFRSEYCRRWRASTLPRDLLELYQGRSLNNLLKDLIRRGIRVSRVTLYNEIKRRASKVPSWRNFLYDERLRSRWTGIMGIDTTNVRILREDYVYLHVVDVPSRIPLAYELLPRETANLIKSVLLEIKEAGYQPRLIIADLAPELLSASKEVFPHTQIQACLYHLIRWLNEQLPTKGHSPVEKHRRTKIKILVAALATDQKERSDIIESLLQIDLDPMEAWVVLEFNERLKAGYYKTLTELAEIGCPIKFCYNNVCERAMGFIKELCARMRNFKSLENAQHYINYFWYSNISQILQRPPSSVGAHWDHKDLAKQILELMPRGLKDLVDMMEISQMIKLPVNGIREMAHALSLLTTTRYAFSKYYLKRFCEKLLKKQPSTLKQASAVTGLDTQTLAELLPELGFKLRFKTLDASNIEIIYPSA